MEFEHVGLRWPLQQGVLERLAQCLPALAGIQAHCWVIVGQDVQDGPGVPASSEIHRHSRQEAGSHAPALGVWGDRKQTDDRCVGRVEGRTAARNRRQHKAHDTDTDTAAFPNDPRFCMIELRPCPVGHTGYRPTVSDSACSDPQQNT